MRRAKDKQLGGKTQLYSTQQYAVHRLLDVIDLPRGGKYLEPGIGVGAIARAMASYELADGTRPYSAIEWHGWEIEPRIASAGLRRMRDAGLNVRVTTGDFLSMQLGIDRFDCSVMNPANSITEACVRKSLTVSALACVYQPLQWYSSATRAAFFEEHRPERILVMPDRPKFVGDDSPMQTWCWYVIPQKPAAKTYIERLSLTELTVRKADHARQSREDEEDFGPGGIASADGLVSSVVVANDTRLAAAGAEADCG
ncbi:MAG: hypothetical protein HOV80_17775 [Polyangiaceae bacterium]|nr:hypothetical protein [Polyangiaceae bacterium]